ncbi:MAG: AmpG family muropeptide MFS transporter [Bacteroidales bacterium]|nr:AmpG family muropeptide MFS transporter [Bacteroidales bacterium]
MKQHSLTKSRPWAWIPSLYYAEGIPYVAVMTISVIMFKRFNLSNTDIALYSSWLYLPWTIKFLWSPFVDLLKTKRWWIVTMQLLIGACLAGVAFSLPTPHWFQYSMAFFWLMAFSSATHDIAADGFYMLGLNDKDQAFFVGIRNTFYRLAMISGQGLLIILAGSLETIDLQALAEQQSDNVVARIFYPLIERMGTIPFAWMVTFLLMALLFVAFGFYHRRQLPHPAADQPRMDQRIADIFKAIGYTFTSFFKKEHSGLAIAFLLLYRFSEAQLLKLSSPFLLDERAVGGLGLSTTAVGTVYGVVGVIALIIGGILGGIAVSRHGLKKWIWPMVLSLTLPNITSVYFAYALPESLWIINAGVAFEQFGYGFGFTAYTIFMLQFSKGAHQTAHYAFCTAFMALGMMLPGMFAGALQEWMGYQHFFIYVMVCALIPIFLVALLRPKLKHDAL